MARWFLILPFCATLIAVSIASGRAAETPSTTKMFEGWTATCNNVKACVVIGTAQDDLFYVRIARAAGIAAPPEVKIVLAAQEPFKGNSPAFRLTAVTGDRRAVLGPFPAVVTDDDASILSVAIGPGEPSLGFIDAIRDATTLDYALLTSQGSLDLKGLAAALRFVDAAQGREGTPTALVARGMTPIGQVPAPPEPPTVEAASAGAAAAIDKPTFSKALIDMAATVCDAEVVKDQADAAAWRLAPGTILVRLPCSQGAYNVSSALYTTNADGGDPQALVLPRPPTAQASDEAANVAVNASFDPKSMELSSLEKGRGLGDCGSAATWVWTGRRFELTQASSLEACPGALPEDWPSVYLAQRK